MSRFTYFFPGAVNVDQATGAIAEHGLAETIDPSRHWVSWGTGPAGDVPGMACTTAPAGSRDAMPKFLPESQTWVECGDGAARFWLGHASASKPGPEDLARPSLIEGYRVKLADGRWWQVPMARAWPLGATKFPETFRVVAGGEIERRVVSAHEDLYTFACGVFDTLSDGKFEADETELVPWAARALSTNYFAGKWELSALGAFDTASLTNVLYALLNLPLLELTAAVHAGKKNLPRSFYERFSGLEGTDRLGATPLVSAS